jgi:hypothetical protein
MVFRAYGIIDDTDNKLLVMGTKKEGYLDGFLVFFGGKTEVDEPSREAFLRELAEESHGLVVCPPDNVHRFETIPVNEPKPATLIFYRCTKPSYRTGEIPHGKEIGSVVAVSVKKIKANLPSGQVTPAQVADAVIATYGGGFDVKTYRTSGIMQALRDYLAKYYP